MITGEGECTNFSPPIDLYVGKVGKGIMPDQIREFLAGKSLSIIDCEKISHPETHAQTFRIKVKGADYNLAMNARTWLTRVRVWIYRHPRFRNQGQAGPAQFS